LFERFAIDQLHHQVRQAGRFILIDLVNGDEVVVSYGGSGASLAAKSLACDFIIRQLWVNHFHSHVASQARIVSVEHHAHTPAPNYTKDGETTELSEVTILVGWLKEIEFRFACGNFDFSFSGTIQQDSGGAHFLFGLCECPVICRIARRGVLRALAQVCGEFVALTGQRFEPLLTGRACADMFRERSGAGFRQPTADQALEIDKGRTYGCRCICLHGCLSSRQCEW
jgi:hypothetical protein